MIDPKVWIGSQASRISRVAARMGASMGHVGQHARQLVMDGQANSVLRNVGAHGTEWYNPLTRETVSYLQ